ncbi:hypothetical protein [Paenibacillus azoreducens]|uniref:Amidase n=1 Tax=Paenibacillus azoreducens TaxID=116718 RepID=A0A919YA03_9BACL|nr:hypothetical protein [Paenibacillus azoreducens]GIO47736.1 hypothetical protein J34TS1_25010 [Paenibacillus azoreducens]
MTTALFKHFILIMVFCSQMAFGAGSGLVPSQTASAQSAYQKATWVWDTEHIRSNPQEVLSFLRKNQVDLVYLQVNTDIPASCYQSFIKQAAAFGMKVDALDGAPEWALESKRHKITDFIGWVKDYQQKAAATEKFHGIHVDIEPHVLANWKTDQADVIRQWQSNILYLRSEADKLNLPLAADIAFWLGNYKTADGKQSLSRFVIGQFDSVTIMSYRDTAAAIHQIAEQELKDAASLGKTAFTAVETRPSKEGRYISFHGVSLDVMNKQLVQLHDLAKVHPSYAGIAIHDFDGWKDLK